jgi:hypothetical protein
MTSVFQNLEASNAALAAAVAAFTPSAGALAAVNDALVVDVSRASNVVMHFKNTGGTAMAAGVFAFEGSIDSTNGTDGTWFQIFAARSNSNTVESGVSNPAVAAGAGAGNAWETSVNAYKYIRVRCTTAVTAGSVAAWTILRGLYATEPAPAIQAHAVSQLGVFTTTPVTPAAYSLITAATTNVATMKASGGMLWELTAFNGSAAVMYWKLFNKASAPVIGTDVPLLTIPLPSGATTALQFGALGKRFSLGIGSAVTAASDAVANAGLQLSATYS